MLAQSLIRRPTVQAVVAVALAQGLVQPIIVLFMVRQLHLHAVTIGFLRGLGAVGGIGGGLLAGRIRDRLGSGRTMALGVISTIGSLIPLPLGSPGVSGSLGVVTYELASSFGGTLLIATAFGRLQSTVSHGQVAKVTALAGTFLQLAALIGTPVGGVLGTRLGLRMTIIIALGFMLATLAPWLVRQAAAHWDLDETEIR
jgi:MFS family permease